MFCLSVIFEVFPEHRDAFIREAAQQAKNSLAGEQDCLAFEIFESEDDPNSFYFHEVYTDKAAFDNIHIHTPYYAAYKKTAAPYIRSAVRRSWHSV